MKNKNIKKQSIRVRRFTLVELLTVISIIVFLIGLMVPALQKVRVSAWRSSCQNNLHGVGTAFQSYLHDSKDIMPMAAAKPSEKLNDYPRIADLLADYTATQKLLKCPGDRADESLFKTEGSSYEYHVMLGGQNLTNNRMIQHIGISKMFVMFDYENFHVKNNIFTVTYNYDDGSTETAVGRRNYLFADWHVSDLK